MRRLFVSLLLGCLPSLSLAQQSLVIWNWTDYIAPAVIEDFEKEGGIKVDYRTFSSTEALDQALQDGEPIDIAVPSHE